LAGIDEFLNRFERDIALRHFEVGRAEDNAHASVTDLFFSFVAAFDE
jgi:hypothetical protein